MVAALIAANNILYRGQRDKRDITPMKLQKLLYFSHELYFRTHLKPLISEKFEVWKYGPVVRSVYDYFKSFEDMPICGYYKESNGDFLTINENTCFDVRGVFDIVWEKYKDKNGIELSKITHADGTAWSKAFKERRYIINDEDILGDKFLW